MRRPTQIVLARKATRPSGQFPVRLDAKGFPQPYPRVPTIISAGVVLALLVALAVAAFFLSAELIDPSTLEEGVDTETILMSGTVVALLIVFSAMLVHLMRRFVGPKSRDKVPPVQPA